MGGHGYSSRLVCLFVFLGLLTWLPQHCVYSMDSLHTVVLRMVDFDVRTLLSNKSEQKLRSLAS